MKLTQKEKIKAAVKRGFSDYAIEQMLEELINAEIIRLDNVGNPYWESNGESIDPDVELVFD